MDGAATKTGNCRERTQRAEYRNRKADRKINGRKMKARNRRKNASRKGREGRKERRAENRNRRFDRKIGDRKIKAPPLPGPLPTRSSRGEGAGRRENFLAACK